MERQQLTDIIIPPEDSDDSMLDDSDEDPDYQPYEKNKHRRCDIFSAESGNVEDSVPHRSIQLSPMFPDFGSSSNIVLQMAEVIPQHRNHLLYFDNWFSSPNLFIELAKVGIGALDTIRTNRFGGLTFKSDLTMKNSGRGCFEKKRTNIDGIELRALKWFDNRGVVLANGLISYYRIEIRSKKYYLQFSFHFIDMCFVSSWLLYRDDCETHGIPQNDQVDSLQYRADVAAALCCKGKQRGGPRNSANSIDQEHEQKRHRGPTKPILDFTVKRDGYGQWSVLKPDRQRCKKPGCKGLTSMMCSKCSLFMFNEN
ncbi:hypothetical protein ILUMI_25304 [Ignelater luminosus]|uniref:PiggyBac transposable element-derived protein domain-containing protein n=1 Tax=Ignelater luminosus TaxID=2038154 RepID=A0A8K0CBY8_IGNLU|nr:hypothetical protein ILUMI_25304 [Ignelater luminosus]